MSVTLSGSDSERTGEMMNPPVGKSGVNHRLRKLGRIADELREIRRIIMIKKPITIQISNGLEARPVAMLVQVASQYESRIQVESGDKHVNAKSIMGMMTLGLNVGESVTICAEGTDEEAAIEGIEKYLTSK